MNIVMYCQYVFGIGHLIRTYRIAEELAKDHRVTMICGGIPVKEIFINSRINTVFLDPVCSDDSFSRYFSAYDKTVDYSQLSSGRIAKILETLQEEKPDVFWVEGFPFARKKVRLEIISAIDHIRKQRPKCEVISSVRDILIKEGGDPAYNQKVSTRLNEYFDTLFIHSDPLFVPLEYTFGPMNNIKCKIVYTGYVTRISEKNKLEQKGNGFIVNYGGSDNGNFLIDVVISCHDKHFSDTPLQIFLNPTTNKQLFEKRYPTANNICFNNFSTDYVDHLASSNLSISLGGYNSVMETIANKVPAIIVALAVNDEQALRIKKLKDVHSFRCININELNGQILYNTITDLVTETPVNSGLDLNGAAFIRNYFRDYNDR